MLREFREQAFGESDRQVIARATNPKNGVQIVADATYSFDHELRQYPAVELDLCALHAHADRIVLAVGRESWGYPSHEVHVELGQKDGQGRD